MKKLLSLLLTLSLLGTSLTAFADIIVEEGEGAGGFGDNNVEVEDTLDDDEIEASLAKPLYFNDFENCTFPGTAYFSLADTGDEAYGKAMKASFIDLENPGKGYAAITGSQSSSGKYVRNGVEYKTFNEPLTANTDYILGFSYKVTDAEFYYGSALGALSFAPQIAGSRFDKSNDYKYYLPVVTDWKQEAVFFNSKSASTINIKVNTQGSNVTTWVDNYGIYEPVKLTVKGLNVDLDITKGVYTDGYLGKGAPLVASAPEGLIIVSAKMNGKSVEVVDGKLDIAAVTGNVEVSVVSELANLNKNYVVKNGYVYIPKGQPIATFVEKALAEETYTLTDSEGKVKPHDGVIYPGDKLSVKINDTDFEEFGFKYIIDTAGTDQYVVSDIVYILDCLLGNKEAKEEDDLNGSGTLTVSDLVVARYHILTADRKYTIDEAKLAAEKAKVAADAKAYGITEEMLTASVTNEGNRSRVANVMKKALRGENITIATIGGSITEGTGISPADGRAEKCWAALMADWWKRMFPGQVKFVNAGISGTNSNFGLFRLETDVLCHDPDLLFIEFAVNDGAAKGSMRSCQEALILKMLERGDAAIQMFFTTVSYNGEGGQVTYAPVGQHYDIPQISPRDAFWGKEFHAADGKVYSHFKDTEGTGLSIATDGTHPNIRGNAMVAVLTNNYLNGVYESLNEISSTPNAIPESTFEDDTPNYMNMFAADIGLMEKGVKKDRVTVIDFGCFSPKTSSTTFRSHCEPMYGVGTDVTDDSPIVIDVDDCKVFKVFSETAVEGAEFTVEVYERGTDKLIASNTLKSFHGGVTLRSHPAVFESIDGKDITVKISPILETGNTLTIRNLYLA